MKRTTRLTGGLVLLALAAACNSGRETEATARLEESGSSPAAVDPAPRDPNIPVGLAVGNYAPDIEGTDLDGNAFKLSDYRGKVVMLDFWGDW